VSTVFEALTLIFERSGQSAHLDIPAEHRLIFLTNIDGAVATPTMPAGTYHVSADAIPGSSPFPIAVAVVADEHVPSWTALTQEQVGRILARCAREVASVRETGACVQ
jgi:hypothetical protein